MNSHTSAKAKQWSIGLVTTILEGESQTSITEFRQPLPVQSHLEMPGILVQLGHIQRT